MFRGRAVAQAVQDKGAIHGLRSLGPWPWEYVTDGFIGAPRSWNWNDRDPICETEQIFLKLICNYSMTPPPMTGPLKLVKLFVKEAMRWF